MLERQIVSTGQSVRIDRHSLVDRVPEYDPRSGEHLWTVVASWRVDPQQWNSPDPTVMPILDAENLLAVAGPGCYFCEQVYTPRLAKRRCPGEPR